MLQSAPGFGEKWRSLDEGCCAVGTVSGRYWRTATASALRAAPGVRLAFKEAVAFVCSSWGYAVPRTDCSCRGSGSFGWWMRFGAHAQPRVVVFFFADLYPGFMTEVTVFSCLILFMVSLEMSCRKFQHFRHSSESGRPIGAESVAKKDTSKRSAPH